MVCAENGAPVLYGVVSHGVDCGKPNFPGVYGKVSYVRDWIIETTGGNHTHEAYSSHTTQICGGNLVAYSGTITSENYGNMEVNNGTYPINQQCTWTITVPRGMLIELTLNDIDIEYESECLYDRLQVKIPL